MARIGRAHKTSRRGRECECIFCEHRAAFKYCGVHDAYYCVECGGWQEAKCTRAKCYACKDRPLTAKELLKE